MELELGSKLMDELYNFVSALDNQVGELSSENFELINNCGLVDALHRVNSVLTGGK